MKNVLLFIFALTLLSCTKTNEQKKQIIKERLMNTNEHVKNGAWYAKQHGELIIPEILKKNDIDI